MAMSSWSSTAALNILANTGINCDEGQSPSSLNDSIREIMAVLKTAIDTGSVTISGNLVSGATCTAFAGATTLLTLGGTGATSVVAIPGTKASTSSTTGSVTFAGGIGVAGNSNFGSTLGVTGAGTFSSTLTAADNAGLAATKKLYLDGVAMTGDTYIFESGANVLDLYAGGSNSIKCTGAAVTIPGTLGVTGLTTITNALRVGGAFATSGTAQAGIEYDAGIAVMRAWGPNASTVPSWKLRLAASDDSGTIYPIQVSATGAVTIPGTLGVTGAGTFSSTLTAADNAGLAATKKLYLDGVAMTGDTYIFESGANVLDLYAGGSNSIKCTGAAVTIPGTLGVTGMTYINDTSNAFMTKGLTINQGAADDEILAFKSSDIAHPFTAITEIDTFGGFNILTPDFGGLAMQAISEGSIAAMILALVGAAPSTTKSTAGTGAIQLDARLTNGSTGATVVGADGNLVVIRTNATTRFIFDSDGDSHQDVGTAWTNFDEFDDVATLDALAYNVARPDDPIKRKFGEWMTEKRDALTRNKIVTFNDDGHHFVNMSKLTMLNTGAIRQLGLEREHIRAEIAQLSGKLARLEQRA